MPRTTLPLQLSTEITTASGTRFRLDDDGAPGNRLQGVQLTDGLGDGFKTASGRLSRRFDVDFPDLNLVDTWTFVGADGSTAWEGRNAEMPRELTDKSTISISLAGWMAHARDQPFTEVYVDRDATAWGPPSVGRRAGLLSGGYTINDPSSYTDPTDRAAGVTTGWQGPWASPYLPISEAQYDIGPNLTIGAIAYSWKRDATIVAVSPWVWSVNAYTDDKATGSIGTGNLLAAGPGSGTLTPGAGYRYGALVLAYGTTGAGNDGYNYYLNWYNLAVYGSHGLTTYTGEAGQPPGVLASDVIKDIARRYCPKLDTTNVQATGYPIQHLVFKELTDPYDAFLQVNKYHLWNLAVWEDKKLTYSSYNLDDYDWQVRAGEDGATFQAQGQSTDNLFNGVVVTYTDVLTGQKNILLPRNYTELQSSDILNPWSMHGIDRTMKLELTSPSTQDQALQVGRIALAQANTPKGPGTITAKGWVRDRQGNLQPGWKVRSGDRIAVTNHPNDAPRLIHEKSWDCDSHTLTLAVDAPPAMLDAYMERQGTALTARGLT